MIGRLCVLASLAASVGTAAAAEMEIRWNLPDGKVSVERRELVEKGATCVFTLGRDEIISRKAKSVELTPDFARAKKGDPGSGSSRAARRVPSAATTAGSIAASGS